MYKLKNVVKRGSALLGAVSLLTGIGSSLAPVFVHADALNPLTQRSLLLSSSSPGWAYTDGSGNSTYATPNSGTNGLKSGETFSFKVSTNSTNTGPGATNVPVKAFTFQYCTTAAGQCTAPGNDSGTVPSRGADSSTTADLNVVTATPTEIASAGSWTTIQARTNNPPTQPNQLAGVPLANDTEGNFVVLKNGTYDGGWTMGASNLEDGTTKSGKNNYITLIKSAGIAPAHNDAIQVIFFATNGNYITNPGAGAFFVKINDYSSDTLQNFRDNYPTAATPQNVIDGGVTVANIMNQSIQIQTKVLETMDFSVGIVDPDTINVTNLTGNQHGQCDPILTGAPGTNGAQTGTANSLYLGHSSAENSLETGTAYDAHSYWRLSSNSSGGATVYYSGSTLSNTEGDQIKALTDTAPVASHPGTEQFGLAIDSNTDATNTVDTTKDAGNSSPDNGGTLDTASAGGNDWVTKETANAPAWHNPQLAPLVATSSYGGGKGTINGTFTAGFAFKSTSNTIPVPIATESAKVVDCVTAKMRYIGNIAATTPAGIYTTKINYLAAPQY